MPGEGPLLLDLFPLVGYIVAAGMVYALFAIVKGFGGVLGAVNGWTGGVLSFVLSPATAGFKWLDHELGTFAQTLDRQIAISFHRVARLVIDTAELFVGVSGLILLLAWKYSGLNAAIHLIRQEVHIGRVAHATSRTIIEKVTRVERITEHTATSTAKAVAGEIVLPRVGEIEHDLASLRARTGAIEQQLADAYDQIKAHGVSIAKVGGIAAVAAGILKLGLGWTRCNNVGKVGKALCGSPLHRIEELLALATDFFVIEDICQVIGLLEKAVAPVLNALSPLIATAGAALCHGEHQAPDQLGVPTLHLPPVLPALPV